LFGGKHELLCITTVAWHVVIVNVFVLGYDLGKIIFVGFIGHAWFPARIAKCHLHLHTLARM